MKNDFLMNTKEPQYSGNDNGEIVPDYYIDLNEQSRKEYDSNQPQFKNDIRALENQNPIPKEEGGDAYLVNGNMIPITTAMKQSADDADQTVTQSNPERRRYT